MSSLLAAHHGQATNGFLVHHGAHALMLGWPLVLLAVMFAALELTRAPSPTPPRPLPSSWLALPWAAAASIHLAVVPEHVAESMLFGAFFLLLGVLQCGYAVALVVHASRRLLVLGLVLDVSVVALWAYSRTVGAPLGLGPREPVGLADLASTALEVVAAVLAGIALRRSTSLPRARPYATGTTAPTGPGRHAPPAIAPAPRPRRS